MNDNLKQFTADLATELKAKLQDQATTDFIDKVKASGDDRTFEVVMSTSDEDRQGDSLDQSTWDFKYFDMNPVVLFAHNYSSFPIGVITDIKIEGNKAVATGKFAPAGVNADADLACALYQEKILRAVSPGYIQNDDGTRELLEVSFCPVPAGRYALSMRQVHALGVSTRDLITKGFFIVEKGEEVGGKCETDDGGLGILADDPKNPGHLVCVPNEEGKAKAETKTMNEELTKTIQAEQTRHGEAVAKGISDYSDDKEKSIDEFEKTIDEEHAEHLAKCMKAIDENYELEDQKKSIDEFKTAMQGEHIEHVKCFDKAIDEFKSALADGNGDEDRTKAIDEFTTKSATELTRHGNAQDALVKAEMGEGESDEEKAIKEKGVVADTLEQSAEWREKGSRMSYIQTVIYAFCDAYYESPLDSFGELITEAIQIIEAFVATKKGDSTPDVKVIEGLVTASLKNAEKMKEIATALGTHDSPTHDVIARLKELMGSPQEDEGEEQEAAKAAALKKRSSPPVATEATGEKTLTEFESFMLSRKVLKAVYQSAGEGLTRISKELREKYPNRRG